MIIGIRQNKGKQIVMHRFPKSMFCIGARLQDKQPLHTQDKRIRKQRFNHDLRWLSVLCFLGRSQKHHLPQSESHMCELQEQSCQSSFMEAPDCSLDCANGPRPCRQLDLRCEVSGFTQTQTDCKCTFYMEAQLGRN